MVLAGSYNLGGDSGDSEVCHDDAVVPVAEWGGYSGEGFFLALFLAPDFFPLALPLVSDFFPSALSFPLPFALTNI